MFRSSPLRRLCPRFISPSSGVFEKAEGSMEAKPFFRKETSSSLLSPEKLFANNLQINSSQIISMSEKQMCLILWHMVDWGIPTECWHQNLIAKELY